MCKTLAYMYPILKCPWQCYMNWILSASFRADPVTSLDLTDCSVRMYNVECQYRCLDHAWTLTRENLTSLHANSKGVNQPVHPRILISAFVIRCFESMIAEVAMCEISIDTPCLSSIVWVVKDVEAKFWKYNAQRFCLAFNWWSSYGHPCQTDS